MTATITLSPETVGLIKLRESLNLSARQTAGIVFAGWIYWQRVERGEVDPDPDWLRVVVADLEDYAAGRPAARLNGYTVADVACPKWCEGDHGVEPQDLSGIHHKTVRHGNLALDLRQYFGIEDGALLFDAPTAVPGFEFRCDEDHSADELRELSGLLLTAAAELERISA